MAWLITHMWMTLAAAGVLGLIFGWAFRGAMMIGKVRRASVDRDVALTELEQAKTENEELWVAQRSGATAAAGAGDEALKGELEARGRRMTELSEELANSKAELEQLRQNKMAEADDAEDKDAAAPEVDAPLDANIDAEESSLVWRNRHLESRVRHLEGKVHEMSGASAASVDADIASADDADAEGEPESNLEAIAHDKLLWRADYLAKRVAFMETQMGDRADDTSIDAAASADTPQGDASQSDVNEEESTTEEEMASLRWRNRYLEGRLAYYEGETEAQTAVEAIVDEVREDAAAQIDEANESILSDIAPTELSEAEDRLSREELDEAVAAVGAAVAAGADELELDVADEVVVLSDAVQPVSVDDADEVLSVSLDELEEDDLGDAVADAPDDDGDAEVTPDDAAQINLEKPLSLDGPVGGHADDLTVIGGVGPKIQEVLNTLGVYHYDQIAAWTPENMAWVDDHLSFSGRIMRERWVEQAKVLVDDSD